MIDHRVIDQRSLAFGRAIAEKLAHDPGLVDHAKANIARWLESCSTRMRSTLSEWSDALNGSLTAVIGLLTADDECSARLRQSNPFAGALSPAERTKIILRFSGVGPHEEK